MRNIPFYTIDNNFSIVGWVIFIQNSIVCFSCQSQFVSPAKSPFLLVLSKTEDIF